MVCGIMPLVVKTVSQRTRKRADLVCETPVPVKYRSHRRQKTPLLVESHVVPGVSQKGQTCQAAGCPGSSSVLPRIPEVLVRGGKRPDTEEEY